MLALPKLLAFGKTSKKVFFSCFCTHLIVTLASPKVLSFGKTQINLVFHSLIRTFAADFDCLATDERDSVAKY